MHTAVTLNDEPTVALGSWRESSYNLTTQYTRRQLVVKGQPVSLLVCPIYLNGRWIRNANIKIFVELSSDHMLPQTLKRLA